MRNGGEGLGIATEYLKEREQGDERLDTMNRFQIKKRKAILLLKVG